MLTDADFNTVIQMRMAARYLTLHERSAVRHYARNILANCDDLETELNSEPLNAQSIAEMCESLKGALSYGTGK